MNPKQSDEWRPWRSTFIPFARLFEGAPERGVIDVVAAAHAPFPKYEYVVALETEIDAPDEKGLPRAAEEERLAAVLSELYPRLRGPELRAIPVADICRSGKLLLWLYASEQHSDGTAFESIASRSGAKFVGRVWRDPGWREYARLLAAPSFVEGLAADRAILAEVSTTSLTMNFEAHFANSAAAEVAARELAADAFSDVRACGRNLLFGMRVAATIDEVAPAVFLAQKIVQQNGGSLGGWGTSDVS